jgi:hypothetical protein
MRKREPYQLIEEGSVIGGYEGKFSPDYLYIIIDEQGQRVGFGIKNQIKNNTFLLTGDSYNPLPVFIYRILRVKNANEAMSYHESANSEITAINQSTLKYCRTHSIPVVTIGVEHAKLLYIFNTWNRVHHIEREHEVIVTADEICLVPSMQHINPKSFIMENTIRTIVLQGKIEKIIEITEKHFKIFESNPILGASTLPTMNVLQITGMHKNDQQEFADWFTNVATDTQSISEFKYFDDSIQLKEEEYTVEDLFGIYRIEYEDWVKDEVKSWLESYHTESSSARLTQTTSPMNFKSWKTVIQDRFLINGMNLYFLDNLSCFSLKFAGSGTDVNEATAWSQFELDYKKKNEFENNLARKSAQPVSHVNELIKNNRELINMTALFIDENTVTPTSANLSFTAFQKVIIVEAYTSVDFGTVIQPIILDEIPDMKSMSYWDNFNEQKDAIIILPTNKHFKVKSNIEINSLRMCSKYALEQYPIVARPSMTQKFGEEFNSVSNRQGSTQDL